MKRKIKIVGLALLALILLFSQAKTILADDGCSSDTPADAPNLYSISMASSTATLYFVQPATPFDGYVISYGLTNTADNYSVTYKAGSSTGANAYRVNDLFPNTNYYFKVRASNGCAFGPWSQTLFTNLKGATSLPATGPSVGLIALGASGIGLVILGGLMFFLFL